jgi:hypothetical protein
MHAGEMRTGDVQRPHASSRCDQARVERDRVAVVELELAGRVEGRCGDAEPQVDLVLEVPPFVPQEDRRRRRLAAHDVLR